MNPYVYTIQAAADLVSEFKTSLAGGLTPIQAKEQLVKFGPNELGSRQVHWWSILLRQFKSPFIYLLLAAVVLTFALGEILDSSMILLFLLINAILGFCQEYRSEKTLKLLKHYVTSQAKVLRDGKELVILSTELVPGDILVLETGDKILADVRFLEVQNLTVDESILTGESVPVRKISEVLEQEAKEIYQAINLGFAGTMVVNGKGFGMVVTTGKNTVMAGISRLTLETRHFSAFEKGIAKISSFILRLVLVTLVLVFVANILIKGQGANFLELLVFSIALAVSVIPEALPLVTTFSLSRGALHLAKKKVVVKRLSAIEDLGGIEVLCTDKTGTITENILAVDEIYALGAVDPLLYANLAATALDKKKLDPFDIALWDKLPSAKKTELKQWIRIGDIPFNPELRRNVSLVEKNKKYELIVRGAPEVVLSLAKNVSAAKQKEIAKWLVDKGSQGRRVLAVARKNLSIKTAKIAIDKLAGLEEEMEFLGVISFVDPIKESTFQAVKQAKDLGVRIKILTGDSKEVAGAVAKEVGLVDAATSVITGTEFVDLPPKKQHEAIDNYSVFARVSPEQKYKIIQILEEKYEVGFLGEGINDAPALKVASVSLVVQGASDIAREAADIILLQRSLKVVIDGIKEGRGIFANTTKYIRATLTSNFGNFYAVAIASLFIDFLPMLPLQILLLNLLSDFPMIAIAADNVDKNEIAQPRKYQVKQILAVAMILGIVSTAFDFLFFGIFYRISPGVLQTNWFIGSILTELVLLFSIRTALPFFKAHRPASLILWLTGVASLTTVIIPYTHFGQKVFGFVAPTNQHLILILFVVVAYFVCTEAAKLFYYRYSHVLNGQEG
ncbi:MAG: HAD-IC family P-type ATPase [Patescibacteria group bacterium]